MLMIHVFNCDSGIQLVSLSFKSYLVAFRFGKLWMRRVKERLEDYNRLKATIERRDKVVSKIAHDLSSANIVSLQRQAPPSSAAVAVAVAVPPPPALSTPASFSNPTFGDRTSSVSSRSLVGNRKTEVMNTVLTFNSVAGDESDESEEEVRRKCGYSVGRNTLHQCLELRPILD
jgi:hypothetical protein